MAAAGTYRHNPALPLIKSNYPGNKLINGRFANGETYFAPQWQQVLDWQLSTNPQKAEKKADKWAPAVQDCTAALAAPGDVLIWLGHSTFWLQVAGKTLLFDPILFSSVGLRRRHALPCAPEALVGVDYLLLSHGHRDHLDQASLQLLTRQNPQMRAFSALGMNKLLADLVPGLPVQEAGWWQQFDLGPAAPFELFFLPAAHWHRRLLLDTNTVLWGSFLIRTVDRLIYFAGDTAYSGHFSEIEKHFGPLDIGLMPVGAYKPFKMMQASHTSPHEAVKAANVLRVGHVVPMHHGTFDLSDEPASEPLRLLQELAAGGMLRADLHTPAVGEVLPWHEWE